MRVFKGNTVHGNGIVSGELIAINSPISFLGDVDGIRGIIKVKGMEISIAGKVFALPYSTGSTVGPYVMYQLAKYGKAPLAILAAKPDTLMLVGSIMANIPLIINIPEEILNYSGCVVEVNLNESTVLIPDECKASNATA
ncbi:aconitase X swivel domain-containing protein [Caldivirga sp. UBA161]|uniref:aconitase X swivel domain-containing protein n=1 Tax=Caldivirga sp. UBA161 TaxID=1915569 RepID=UPI0025BDCB8B|nr:DUF126 domain-containing protein [Caldivirga sp. UBA161]